MTKRHVYQISLGTKIFRSTVAIILFVSALCLLIAYPIDAGASPIAPAFPQAKPAELKTQGKFEFQARCARLAFGAGLKNLYKEHSTLAAGYATLLAEKGHNPSFAYQFGFIDGNVSQIERINKHKYSRKDIAASLYKQGCYPSS